MTYLTQELRQHLLEAGDVGAVLTTKIQVILNQWLVLEASTAAYHDMFILMATIVLLAAVPVIGLRTRRTPAKVST